MVQACAALATTCKENAACDENAFQDDDEEKQVVIAVPVPVPVPVVPRLLLFGSSQCHLAPAGTTWFKLEGFNRLGVSMATCTRLIVGLLKALSMVLRSLSIKSSLSHEGKRLSLFGSSQRHLAPAGTTGFKLVWFKLVRL